MRRLIEATSRRASSVSGVASDSLVTNMLSSLLDFQFERDAVRGLGKAAASRRLSAAAANMIRNWHRALDRSATEAFRRGAGLAGLAQPDLPLSPAAEALLRQQKAFATRFGLQMLSGHATRSGAMSLGNRIALYGDAIETFAQRGMVDSLPPGELIFWRLGPVETGHCRDCPGISANSPYTVETLPTTPRSGATECVVACKCFLETRPQDPTRSSTEPPTPQEAERLRPLRDQIEGPPPEPPEGLRLPTDAERLLLQDLETQMAWAVRNATAAANAGDDVARDRWLARRRELNREQVRIVDEGDVFWVKSWSDKEILRSVDVDAPDVSWLTHFRGVDGTTVHRAQGVAIRQALQAAQKRVSRLLGEALGEARGEHLSGVRGDLGTLLREVAPDGSGMPLGGTRIVQLLGPDLQRTFEGVTDLLRELLRREYAVQVGPIAGDDWIELVLRTGLWVVGPAEEVGRLLERAEKLRSVGWFA